MKLEEIKEKYKALQDKYGLAGFEELDKEFEINDITNGNIILREIRDRIIEKFDEYVKILEGIVQPDTNLVHMYEAKVFNDDEKNDIFNLYKRFLYLERFSIETQIIDGEEKMSEWINLAFKEWMELKPKILDIIIRLKESWTHDDDIADTASYCG
ncbi:MAG: hypothetical protein ACOC1P_05905 [Minisyncoccales bacterium]